MNKPIKTVLACLAAVAVLALAFWLAFGGEKPQQPQVEQTIQNETEISPIMEETAKEPDEKEPEVEIPETAAKPEPLTEPEDETQTPSADATVTADEQQGPADSETTTEPERSVCTISISCATLLDKLDTLPAAVSELVPADGWILAPVQEEFSDAESVLDILLRVAQREGIHLEYAGTAMGNSAYLEGIGNIYEFDAGELSGWMYSVNGEFPNYGCGQYFPQPGDVIKLVYTCDLGADVGDNYQG